ncbi:DUF3558 domain-containing protein [Nocardia sp. NPDC050710]|uniref:DUF3558 domain-containing protein n=1 Tax=Nocardia sp. NPDC050710 TaxID=3157220 RepID=UPI0033FCF0F6
MLSRVAPAGAERQRGEGMSAPTVRRRIALSGAVIAGALALATGCGDGDASAPTTSAAGTTTPSSATTSGPVTSNASAAFDPCTALTPQFLAQHRWDARTPEPKQTSTGGFTWQGCAYLAQARYTFVVQTTNGTLADIRQKFPTAADITVGGRKAMRYEARPDVPGGCTVNVEMKSGSLYILVDDPRGVHPRKLTPCDNATEIAEAVVPLLPAGS